MASEFPPASVKPLSEEIAALLKEKKETISIAETVRKPAWLPINVADEPLLIGCWWHHLRFSPFHARRKRFLQGRLDPLHP